MSSIDRETLNWNVIYTRPRSEKKVASIISEMGIETYLPLQTELKQWSDRKKKVKVPLFPNYVFVNVNHRTRLQLYSLRQVVTFVSVDKRPAVIREDEILAIKRILGEDIDVVPDDYFKQGRKVRILYGQFAGLQGTVIRAAGKTRLLIRIPALKRAFSFNMPRDYAEAIEYISSGIISR